MPPRARVLVRETEEGALEVVYKTPDGSEYELAWRDYVEPKALHQEQAVASPNTHH